VKPSSINKISAATSHFLKSKTLSEEGKGTTFVETNMRAKWKKKRMRRLKRKRRKMSQRSK
uniref:60S ribosomal protein L41 n=1 Tax=Brassica oleracea var. oleracea TaxID=109376 RepID=A0A0D3AF19_BRAOL